MRYFTVPRRVEKHTQVVFRGEGEKLRDDAEDPKLETPRNIPRKSMSGPSSKFHPYGANDRATD